MSEAWKEENLKPGGLLPPLTPNSRCTTPPAPERIFNLAEMKLGAELDANGDDLL